MERALHIYMTSLAYPFFIDLLRSSHVLFLGPSWPDTAFVRFIEDKSEALNDTDVSHPFTKNGAPISADDFSQSIGAATKHHLGIRLTLQPWRHIAIAIGRDHIRAFTGNNENEEDLMIIDSGAAHALGIQERHDAIDTPPYEARCCGTRLCEACVVQWHRETRAMSCVICRANPVTYDPDFELHPFGNIREYYYAATA